MSRRSSVYRQPSRSPGRTDRTSSQEFSPTEAAASTSPQAEKLVTPEGRERRAAVFSEMLEHLKAIPGVRSASGSMLTPISGSMWNEDLQIEGYTSKGREDTLVYFNRITPGFFETMGITLVAGRDVTARDTLVSTHVALINQTAATKYFARQSPIGKRYRAEEGNKVGSGSRSFAPGPHDRPPRRINLVPLGLCVNLPVRIREGFYNFP